MKEKSKPKKKAPPLQEFERNFVVVNSSKDETRAWISSWNGKQSLRIAVMFKTEDTLVPTKRGVTIPGDKKQILKALKELRDMVKENMD